MVPLAVWADASAGVKDRDRLKLAVPINDGAQADTAYGVESVPRFVVIDGRGVVRWAFAGVGAETGHSVRDQVDRLFPAAAPDRAGGTIGTAGPGLGVATPRP